MPKSHAATIGGSLHVSFVAPTQYTDGTAIPAGAMQAFNLYCGKAPGVYDAMVPLGATATSGDFPVTAQGTYYCAVTAVAQVLSADPAVPGDIRESGYSAEVSKTIAAIEIAPPSAPTNLSITVTVTCQPVARRSTCIVVTK
jgi:hypothetical protein